MKSLKDIIQERLHINKDVSGQSYTPIENLENESLDSKRTCWIAYSPMNSKGKAQFYRGTFNSNTKEKGKSFHISGPYINRNKSNMVCLMADFEKNIQYDEKTIIAGTILSHGYMFVATDKECLNKFNDKNFIMNIKSKYKTDKELKQYLDENIDNILK